MSDARGVWSRQTQKERRDKLTAYIVKRPNVKYGELKKMFPVSPATLSGDLKYLEGKHLIEHFTDPERRNEFFGIVDHLDR